MEDEVNALMGAMNEALWKRIGLFEEHTTHTKREGGGELVCGLF